MKDEAKFSLFRLLLPISVVAPLIVEDEYQSLERMIKCKSLFDMAILDGQNEKLRGVYVNGVKIAR